MVFLWPSVGVFALLSVGKMEQIQECLDSVRKNQIFVKETSESVSAIIDECRKLKDIIDRSMYHNYANFKW
jgi:hypothetical protein